MTFYQMIQALIAKHGNQIGDIVPMDREGMRIYPVGIQEAREGAVNPAAANAAVEALVLDLEAAILPLVAGNNWHITSTHNGNVLIEPLQTRIIHWNESSYHFHVSDRANRISIFEHGLQLKNGGNTTMHRNFPGRIFLARDLVGAIEFIKYQCDRYPNMPPPLAAAYGIVIKQRSQLDVWRVDLPETTVIHADILFPGVAGWIDTGLSPDRVEFIPWWELFEKWWTTERKQGRS